MNLTGVPFSPNVDPRLLMEAFRRARARADNAQIDSEGLLAAIVEEARRGARDMYSLVKAAGAIRQRLAA